MRLLIGKTLLDKQPVCRYAGVELRRRSVESVIPPFRHLLEAHGLGDIPFVKLNHHLAEHGRQADS